MTNAALSISRFIDRISSWLGIIATWLVLCAALLSAANAFFRYFINEIIALARYSDRFWALRSLLDWYGANSNAFLEMQWYMFGAMVMLGAPFTLKVNEHVRVDLLYGSVSERTRTWIDLIGGTLCLLPLCAVLAYFTWPWFVDSWIGAETSTNSGGLIRWPIKLILPVGVGLLFVQGLSEIIKCIAALRTNYVRPYAYEKPLQ